MRKRDDWANLHGGDGSTYEEGIKDFHSDEEPEND